jgi:hydroxymethylbilane synthase
MILKIGTRGSRLALAQSQWLATCIRAKHPYLRVELVRIKTKGDKILDSPLSRIGGKGLFVKEIEEALLRRTVDLAVHSMKDIPAQMPESLTLPIFPKREDPRDALISRGDQSFERLPPLSPVGTSSLRRAAQLLHIRPDLRIIPLRGNVDTRLKKLESGEIEAIILAVSGLNRLGFQNRITQVLPTDQVLPAIGQGTLGVQMRSDREEVIRLFDFLNHRPTELTAKAERSFLKELGGGCQVPIAGLARIQGGRIHMEGLVAELDGTTVIRDQIASEEDRAEEAGRTLARKLLASGADRILRDIYSNAGTEEIG